MDKDVTHTHTHTHTRILFSHKKNEVMPFAATWKELKIILSELSQAEKDIYIPLICGI